MSNAALYSGSNVTSFTSMLHDVGGGIAPTGRSGRVYGSSRTGNELERMREEAKAEGYSEGLSTGFDKGQQAGYQDGVRAGYDDAMRQTTQEQVARLEIFTAELNHVAQLIGEGVATWSAEAETKLTEIVSRVAREVICQELAQDRSSIVAVVKKAISEVTLADQARIRVNPFDSEILKAAQAEILASATALRGIEITEDPTILGGCIIDTTGGQVDATVDGQLKRLGESLEDAA